MNLTPSKVEFFMWLALLGNLSTKDMLLKKGVLPVQENSYTFCQCSSEDLSHLLVLCLISWHIWTSLASDLGHVISRPESFRTFYEMWISIRFKNQTRRKLWVTTFDAAAWSLWMTRNSMIFDHQELDSAALCYTIR